MYTQSNSQTYEPPTMPGNWEPEDLALMDAEEASFPCDEDEAEYEEEERQALERQRLEAIYQEDILEAFADRDWQHQLSVAFLASLDPAY